MLMHLQRQEQAGGYLLKAYGYTADGGMFSTVLQVLSISYV